MKPGIILSGFYESFFKFSAQALSVYLVFKVHVGFGKVSVIKLVAEPEEEERYIETERNKN